MAEFVNRASTYPSFLKRSSSQYSND